MSLRFTAGYFGRQLLSLLRSNAPPHMKTSLSRFDPSADKFITTLFLDRDEEGNFLDVDSTIHHSEEHGFYLARRIIQVWDGSSWETASDVQAEESLREHRRTLHTFRSLTPEQVIRLIVENTVPEEEGARALALWALDTEGIS